MNRRTLLFALAAPGLPAPAPEGQGPYVHSRVLAGHRDVVSALAFSPDGRTLASGGHDGSVRLWDVGTGQVRRALAERAEIASIDFSPDGRLVALAVHDPDPLETWAGIWSVSTGKRVAQLMHDKARGLLHEGSISDLAFSASGQSLATAGLDGQVILWNVDARRAIRTLRDPKALDVQEFFALAYSPTSGTLASATRGIILWNTTTGALIARLGQPRWVHALAYTADGKTLVAGDEDGKLRLWDIPTRQPRQTIQAHDEGVFALAVSRRGLIATSSSPNAVKLWSAHTGERVGTLAGHQNTPTALAFSPDGKRLATGSEDKTVRLWDVSGLAP